MRLLRLSPAEWIVAAEVWWAFFWLDWAIRYRPYRRWRHWLDPLNSAPTSTVATHRMQRLMQIAERVARHHLRPMNCLRRTLVEKRLLERRQINCQLHIGVKAGEQGIEAHAWLTGEHGAVLNDAPNVASRYRELTPEQWGSTLASD